MLLSVPLASDADKDLIVPFASDISGSAASRIVVQTSGTAPNRAFVAQWQNFTGLRFLNARTTGAKDTINFQVRIDENGMVSVSYGRMSFAATEYSNDVQVGLKGRTSSDLQTRVVEPPTDRQTLPWGNSRRGSEALDLCRVAITTGESGRALAGVPPVGLVFAWLPAGVSLGASAGMSGGGGTGGMMSMMPATASTAAQLQLPANGAMFALPGTVRWNAVEGATAYRVVVADNADLNEPLIDVPVSGTQFFVRTSTLNPTAGAQYFWAVQAQRGEQVLPRSEVRSWRTLLEPRVRQATQRMFYQGQTVTFSLFPEFFTFPANTVGQTLPVVFMADSGNVGGTANTPTRFSVTEARVVSSTALTITMTVPESAQIGTWGISLSGDTATDARQRNLFTIRPADNPPVTSGFNPRVHGFKFDNSEESVWNQSVWGGIDYSSSAFPAEVQALNARSSDFPSWADYTAAWERRNSRSAFTDAERRQPRREVVTAWRREKTKWGGSCHGFATTALAAWAGIYTFDRPVFELDVNPTLRTLINRNQIFQDNPKTGNEDDGTPNSAVRQIIESWKRPRSEHFEVGTYNIVNGESKGAHALVPYRITTTLRPDGDIIDSVYCYDMNFPGAMDSAIAVNRTRNTWTWWGLLNSNERAGDQPWRGSAETASFVADGTAGTNWLVAQNTVQPAAAQAGALAAKPNARAAVANTPSSGAAASDELFQISFGDDDTTSTASTPFARLTNRLNQRIESRGALSLRPQIPDASLVRPISTSANAVANGFNVPAFTAERFRLEYTPNAVGRVNALGWDIGRYGLYTEFSTNLPASPTPALTPVTLEYNRATDYVKIVATQPLNNAGLAVYKNDPTDSLWTNYIQLDNYELAANDSVDVQLLGDGASFTITNFGAAKRFGMYLERYDSTAFSNILLPARSRQTYIVEDWNVLRTCDIQVFMDRGLRGRPDTTYFLRRAGRVQTSVQDGARTASNGVSTLVPTPHHLSITPNPATNEASVRYVLFEPSWVTVEIADVLGHQVMTVFEGKQGAGRHTVEYHTQHLSPGTYICRVIVSHGVQRSTETRLLNVVR